MTLTKLAKLANVAVSTVSKAFSMHPDINEETRKIIFDLAKQHGCFKKYYNANYPKLVIAIICPDVIACSNNVKSIQARLAELNCETCITATNYSRERELELVEYYEKYVKADGIVLISPRSTPPSNIETPIVLLDPYDMDAANAGDFIIASRSIDAAYKEAINHFVDRGITDIAFIGDKLSISKCSLFRKFMTEKFGFVDENKISISEQMSPEGGYQAMASLLDKGYIPRGVISAYFNFTAGAANVITDRGLRIPEDIAIITFSNSDIMNYISPGFSGVNSFDDEICTALSDALVNKINGQDYQKNIFYNSVVIHRKSSDI